MATSKVSTIPTASKPFSSGLVLDDKLHLTPGLFAELDAYARTVAGYVCDVLPPEVMRGNFATVRGCGDIAFYRRLPDFECRGTRHRFTDSPCGVIELANVIDLGAFRSAWRPELDWSAIPTEDIYRFLLAHEIAHVRYMDTALFWFLHFPSAGSHSDKKVQAAFLGLEGNPQAERDMKLFTEARADRTAWEALYPDTPMPLRADAADSSALAAAYDKYHVLLDRPRAKPLRPVGLFPEFTIMEHVKQGFLLWSQEVCESLFSGTERQARTVLERILPVTTYTMEAAA